MNPLKRIITACLLAPCIVLIIYFTTETQFFIISVAIFSLILKEWNYVAHISYKGFIWIAWVVILALSYWILQGNTHQYLYYICGYWGLLFLLVLLYPKLNLCQSVVFRALSLMVIVFGSWLALNQLKINHSPHHLMYLLLLVWASDMGGYFIGKKYGRIKLSAFVSPNKTIAGLLGSFIFGIGICLIAMQVGLRQIIDNYTTAFMLAMFTVMISVFGDLVESMFKRELGIKESGSILPGHGGIVDRTDSLIAAIPFYLLALFLI